MIRVTVVECGRLRSIDLEEGALDAFKASLTSRGGTILELQSSRSPLKITLLKRKKGASSWAPWFSALARTLKGNVPLDQALELLAPAAPAPEEILSVHRGVLAGRRFSDAVSDQIAGLPSLVPALLRAGEAAGDLARGAALAHSTMENLLAFQRELKARLSYPLVVVSAASIALSVLMAKVFPAMAGMWVNLGKPLPAKLEVIRVVGWVAIVLLLLLAGGMAWLMSGDERAQQIPGFRTLGRHRNRSELWSALGMALGGGVPLLDALSLLRQKWGAQEMRQDIQKGVRPEDALIRWVDDAPGQRAVLLASLRVGDLAGGASSVAEGYRELLEADLKSLQRWLEPVILLLLGGILMALAWSLFSIMGEMEHGLVK